MVLGLFRKQAPPMVARIPRLPFEWKQGEHLTLVGDTGSGKTTLGALLLGARRYTIAFKSKADDTTMPGRIIKTARAFELDKESERFVLYPKHESQLGSFWRAIDLAWKQGGWCIYLDELFYLDRLGLRDKVEMLLTQGRSNGITVMSGMQRPVSVTRFAMGESKHLITFSVEGRDVKTLAEVGGNRWAEAAESLERYQFAWYYRPTREVFIGRAQDLDNEYLANAHTE